MGGSMASAYLYGANPEPAAQILDQGMSPHYTNPFFRLVCPSEEVAYISGDGSGWSGLFAAIFEAFPADLPEWLTLLASGTKRPGLGFHVNDGDAPQVWLARGEEIVWSYHQEDGVIVSTPPLEQAGAVWLDIPGITDATRRELSSILSTETQDALSMVWRVGNLLGLP